MADGDQVTQKSYAYMREHPDEAPMQFSPESDLEIPETFEGAEGWGEEGRAADETEEQRLAREAAETDAAAQGEPPANEGEETAEEKATREAAEARKPKFDSIEEYDKAYKEAETKMHTATQETKREKEAREALEAKAEALEKELVELRAKPPAKPEPPASTEESDAQFEAVAEAANEEAINAIAALEDPDTYDQEAVKAHNKKVAAIWAKAHAKINRAGKQTSVSQEDIDRLIDQRLETKDAAAKVAREQVDTDAAAARAWQEVVDHCKKAGLPVDKADAPEADFLEAADRKLPKELQGQGATEAVKEYYLNYVRSRAGKVVEQTDEQRKRAAEHQKGNYVMGKGTNFTPSKQPAQRSYTSMRKERETEGGLI